MPDVPAISLPSAGAFGYSATTDPRQEVTSHALTGAAYQMPLPTGIAATDETNLTTALTAVNTVGGIIQFQAGTYNFTANHAIGDFGSTSVAGSIIGVTLRGMGAGTTVLSFAPSSAIFLFTVGDGTNTFAFVNFEDMSMFAANTTASGLINFKDPCDFCTVSRVQFIGTDTSHGIAILLSGTVSANSHHLFQRCSFRIFLTAMQFSGNANSNLISECWFGTVGKGVFCEATGTDTSGGDTNLFIRCEFDGSTTTAVQLASVATNNVFVGCTFDSTTADFNISASSTNNYIIACSFAVGKSTFTGAAATSTFVLSNEWFRVPSSSSYGVFGVTPVTRQTTSTDTHTVAAGSVTNVFTNTTFDGSTGATAYTIGDIVKALKNYGFLTS